MDVQAHRDYDASHHDKEMDQQAIIKEIGEETMTNKERAERVKEYFHRHDNSAKLLACGSCGIREMQSPTCKYIQTYLRKLGLLRYDISQQAELEFEERKAVIRVPFATHNGSIVWKALKPFQAKSYYEATDNEISNENEQQNVSDNDATSNDDDYNDISDTLNDIDGNNNDHTHNEPLNVPANGGMLHDNNSSTNNDNPTDDFDMPRHTIYHLHPELVSHDDRHCAYTMLCPPCNKYILE